MPLLAMVKAKWILFGLEAPQFIWNAAALLLLGTLAQSLRLWRLITREQALHRRIIAQLEAIQAEYSVTGRTGLAEAAYEAVVQVFREHPPLLPAWYNFEAQMLRQADTAGQRSWWATASATSAFNATTVIEPRLNQSFFAALPGMVTGLGLLGTLIAILAALLDVRLVDGQFQGLDNLSAGSQASFCHPLRPSSRPRVFSPSTARSRTV